MILPSAIAHMAFIIISAYEHSIFVVSNGLLSNVKFVHMRPYIVFDKVRRVLLPIKVYP